MRFYALRYGFLALILQDFTFFNFRTFPFFALFSRFLTLLTVQKLLYWKLKQGTINDTRVFKSIVHGFNNFNNPFSRNSIEFFLSCRFCFVFLVVCILLEIDRSHFLDEYLSLFSDFSRQKASWHWKQLFHKKKQFLISRLFFFVYFLPSLVNYWSRMTLLLSEEGQDVQILMCLMNSLWMYWLRHGFFAKKK